jgi:hypothetical protein
MTLYEIDAAILALANEDGEITDYEALDALTMERDRKLENVACWIKDLTAEAKAIREEEKALAERRQKAENKAERLKEYLDHALQGQKFSTARCAVNYRTSTSTVCDDEEKLLKWLRRNKYKDCYTTTTSLVRSGIGALIKQGVAVPGAHLEEKKNLNVK